MSSSPRRAWTRSVFVHRPEPEQLRGRISGVRGWIWVWLPVVLACVVIAFESTDTFSSEHTSGWIRPYFEHIFGHINDTVWALGHHVARKCGHFGGYGTVCLAWLRAFLLTLAQRPGLRWWRTRSCGLALAGTFCVAGLDEWHQTFIPSRTGMFSDVLLDTFGGAVMCSVVWLIFWRTRRLRER